MKILVVASGRHGTTEEIAATIAVVLGRRGFEVDLRDPGAVTSLAGYDAVVAGSCVHLGRWMAPMRTFVQRFEEDLRARPVWLFTVGPSDGPVFAERTSAEVAGLTTRLEARGHLRLAARHGDPLSWRERALARAKPVGVGEFQEWRQVDVWTRHLAASLLRSHASIG